MDAANLHRRLAQMQVERDNLTKGSKFSKVQGTSRCTIEIDYCADLREFLQSVTTFSPNLQRGGGGGTGEIR